MSAAAILANTRNVRPIILATQHNGTAYVKATTTGTAVLRDDVREMIASIPVVAE